VYASDIFRDQSYSSLGCPLNSNELVEVSKFLPSANSNSTNGICYVKVNYYSWWDLISNRYNPQLIEVNAGNCDSNNFLPYNGKKLIKAEIMYLERISRCESNPGCFYECKPQVQLEIF